MSAKHLKIFPSMAGTFGIGWKRDDAPMMHLFANEAPGALFQPSNGRGGPHWPCPVCEAHGYTKQDFYDQIEEALERGPEPSEQTP